MQNIFWMVPGHLAGRSGPSLAPWNLADLRAAGIHAILNVSEIAPDVSGGEESQIDMAWMPLPNDYPATLETEKTCREVLPKALGFVTSHLDEGRPVLVHCVWGRDRTGLVLAHYLASHLGLTPRDAIAKVREIRPKALSALGWEEMAERVISELLSSAGESGA